MTHDAFMNCLRLVLACPDGLEGDALLDFIAAAVDSAKRREEAAYTRGLSAAAACIERLQRQVAAYQDWSKTLSGYIVATHKQGVVDDAAVAILDGYHVGLTPVAGPGDGGENTLAAALRLLKLAKQRGAFDPPRAEWPWRRTVWVRVAPDSPPVRRGCEVVVLVDPGPLQGAVTANLNMDHVPMPDGWRVEDDEMMSTTGHGRIVLLSFPAMPSV